MQQPYKALLDFKESQKLSQILNVSLCLKLWYYCRLVIEALKETDPNRRCFRLVGGVLVERTVAEVLPALQAQIEQVL